MTREQFICGLKSCGFTVHHGEICYEHDELIKCFEDLGLLESKSEWEQDHEILKAYSDGANEVLDKIRAEIEQLTITKGGDDYVRKMAELFSLKMKVLQIIDKYKAESENT